MADKPVTPSQPANAAAILKENALIGGVPMSKGDIVTEEQAGPNMWAKLQGRNALDFGGSPAPSQEAEEAAEPDSPARDPQLAVGDSHVEAKEASDAAEAEQAEDGDDGEAPAAARPKSKR